MALEVSRSSVIPQPSFLYLKADVLKTTTRLTMLSFMLCHSCHGHADAFANPVKNSTRFIGLAHCLPSDYTTFGDL